MTIQTASKVSHTPVRLKKQCSIIALHFIASRVQPSMNRKVFENCNQSSQYKKFPLQRGNHHMQLQNQHLCYVSPKINGTQRRAHASPLRMHCIYCGMSKRRFSSQSNVKE